MGYLYYHIYDLVNRYKRYNAREAAIIYLTMIVFLLTFPIIGYIDFKLFGTKNELLFLLTFLAYGYLIYLFNSKLIRRKFILNKLLRSYANESKVQKMIGYVIVTVLLIASPIIGFTLLSFI